MAGQSFAEWDAARKAGGNVDAPPDAPVDTGVAMHHPGLYESPTEAAIAELGRTGKEAAIGLAKSPLDYVSNLATSLRHPIDTLENLGHAVINPGETIKKLGDNPREAGSALGQLLLGKYTPNIAEAAPGPIGRGVSAVGRGMETVSQLPYIQRAASYGGLGELIYRHDPYGALIPLAPKAMEVGGQGLQRIGGAIEDFSPSDAVSSLRKAVTPGIPEPPPSPEAIAAQDAGFAAQDRSIARKLGETGYKDPAIKKIAGVSLRKAKNFSREVPMSDNGALDYPGIRDLYPAQQEDLAIGRGLDAPLEGVASETPGADQFGGDRTVGSTRPSVDVGAPPEGLDAIARGDFTRRAAPVNPLSLVGDGMAGTEGLHEFNTGEPMGPNNIPLDVLRKLLVGQ